MDDLDALLADLQNSVPGHQKQPQQYGTTTTTTTATVHEQPKKLQAAQSYGHDSSGYGSLRGKERPQSPIYQEPFCNDNYSSQVNHYKSKGAIPRNLAYNTSTTTAQVHNNANNAKNIDELDTLLQDLSNGRYHSNFEKKENVVPVNYNGQPSKYNTYNSYTSTSTEKRPTVDSLLNEMDGGPIYAVPNGTLPKSPTPGRHVTITVRETKTEKVTGPEGPVGVIEEQTVQKKDSFNPLNGEPYPPYTSQTTKELDELMASLSDFKVNNGTNHQYQTVTDYATPNKGVSHLTQTITETTSTVVEEPGRDQLESMLHTLQENMSRQGVNTVQKGCCNACEKPIVGQVISALGKTWHPEHFTCNHCSQELGTRNFFERDGLPYCETDYHNLFSPRCAYCNGAILDKCVTALDKTWHPEHFFCAQCGQQFGEDGFHERDGKPYCRNDYFEMFAPKCNGCNRAIMENYISALNSQWHPDCFVCRDCKKAVRGKSFYAMEGKPVCPSCVGVDEEE